MSAHSQHLMNLQNEFKNATSMHTIVYIDRAIISERLPKMGDELTEEEVALRNKVVSEFVKERIGVSLDNMAADNLGDYYSTGMNVAVPTEIKTTGENICAVFGSNPNNSARAEAERFLYWKEMKGHTQEYDGLDIAQYLTEQEFHLLADMHETFHCLDPYYIPKQKVHQYENEPTVHRAESFAEIGALLYLAEKRGMTNLTETRALFRIVGSFMVGRYGDELIGRGPEGINFGVVYSFYAGMFAAQKIIDQNQVPHSLLGIEEMAHSLVEENAIDSFMSHALTQYQKRPENLQKLIEEFKNSDNEALRNRFIKVEKHRDEYVKVVDWAFSKLFRFVD